MPAKKAATMAFTLALSALGSLTAEAKGLTIGVIADMNGSACQARYPANSLTAYNQLLSKTRVDHIIMTGDAVAGECMSYKGSTPYQTVVRNMWEEFDKRFSRRAHDEQNADLILAPGNHDAPFLFSGSRETFKIENAEFDRYWTGLQPRLGVTPLRVAGASDNFPYYWAYVYEDVLFVVLQSTRTHTLSDAAIQKKWLRAVLQSPEARAARARIAFGHVPAYAVLDPSVGSKAGEIIEKEQVGVAGGLMDLLLDHRVDLMVVGHSHAPYPAELTRVADGRKMKVLSMPCGHAPRKLKGKTTLAPRGYAVLEIGEDGQIGIGIRNYSDGKAIPLSYFPSSISQGSKVKYERVKALN